MARETKTRAAFLLAGLGLVLAIPVAYSQTGDPGALPKGEDASKLSNPERLARGRTRFSEMEQALKQMEASQEQARQDKDLLRLSCINEKLTETRGLFTVVTAALTALEQAVKDADESRGLQQYTKVSLAHDRTVELSRQAETCAGETLTYSGDTIVDVTIEPGVPDPTEPGFGELPIDQPTDFSPLQ
jgi:hypothetical protein